MEEIFNGRLNPRQISTLNNLLALGGERPWSSPELADKLHAMILEGTKESVSLWTEKTLYLTKSQVRTALDCPGLLKAQADTVVKSKVSTLSAVGTVSHKAIQIAHTHPNLSPENQVRSALKGALTEEEFGRWWAELEAGEQSDVIMQATSKLVNFIDDWPPLNASWHPRFEEQLSAKVGKLTLSSRADLIIGRPRTDFKQSILICDLKSGNLRSEHEDEAMFYALVATLRYKVAPWRSLVYSLAEGEYSDPDVTEEKLTSAAERVIKATKIYVDTLTERADLPLTPGAQCRFCPARNECPVATLN